jgi:Fic family protein
LSRAIAEKALAEATGQPTLTALARAIQQRRASYYDALEQANKSLEVDAWLDWFADTVLAAQRDTRALIDFTLDKTRLLYRVRGQLNARQEKALLRVLREGPEGFRGGLSAGNYANLTGAPAATARRDLADLVERGALVRTGERKGTRYWLAFNPAPGAAAP